MNKPSKVPNYTRDQAEAAILTLLNLAHSIVEHESYRDVYDEAQSEVRGRAERFKTLERKAARVGMRIQECRDVAESLRIGIEHLERTHGRSSKF